MRIFTIVFCLFLSIHAMGQTADTVAKLTIDKSKIIKDVLSAPVSAKPLLMLDGVVFKGSLKTINPKDISEIKVLKRNRILAMYGPTAENGVILINMTQNWRIRHRELGIPKVLVVVDAVIFKGDLKAIDPNTIESISVLKEEFAIPLYGRAGVNGVIIVTTKAAMRKLRPDTIR